jgi:hypothetical protein
LHLWTWSPGALQGEGEVRRWGMYTSQKSRLSTLPKKMVWWQSLTTLDQIFKHVLRKCDCPVYIFIWS